MHKKDYILIADALVTARCHDSDPAVQRGVDLATGAIAARLGGENPRFDRDKFYAYVDAKLDERERRDSFGEGYPEGYQHAADCQCSDCKV